MKLRTGVLLACLLVVPLLAMFSHKIPRSLRDQWRRHVWQPLAGLATQPAPPAEAAPTGPVEPTIATGPTGGPTSSPASPAKPANAVSAATPTTTATTAGAETATAGVPDAPKMLPEVALRSTLLTSATASAAVTAAEATAGTGTDATVDSLRRRLASLGAVGLQVKRAEAVPNATGIVHVASCRLPVDATGQLQRFFQATAPTAEESVSRLTEQVAAWKSRIATQPAPAAPPASGRFR